MRFSATRSNKPTAMSPQAPSKAVKISRTEDFASLNIIGLTGFIGFMD
jgi:hypothetical protein